MWEAAPSDYILRPGLVHLWKVDLTAPPAALGHYRTLLSPNEQERADRFYFQKDRDHFTVGRGILRELIGKYAKVEPQNIVFNYTQFGKPGLPLQPALKFNLSHSGGLAALGVTHQMEIGIDLEKIDPAIDVRQIARQFFSAGERACLLDLPAAEQIPAFFKCWTSKEAFIKAHGRGLSLPLDQFEVDVIPGQPNALKTVRWDPELVHTWDIRGFVPREGFVGAVVCNRGIERIDSFSYTE